MRDDRLWAAHDAPLEYSHSPNYRLWRPGASIFLPSGELCVSDACGSGRLLTIQKGGDMRAMKMDGTPTGLACAGTSLFVAMGGKRCIQRVPLTGEGDVTTSEAGGPLRFPCGLAIAVNGPHQLFVADATAHCVHILGTDRLDIVRSLGANTLSGPRDITLDASGEILFVADSHHCRIAVLCPREGTLMLSIGCAGDGPGMFRAPVGVALHDGLLFVAEADGRRLQVLTTDGKPLQATAPPLQPDGATEMSPITQECGGFSSVCVHQRRVCVVDFEVHALHYFELPRSYEMIPAVDCTPVDSDTRCMVSYACDRLPENQMMYAGTHNLHANVVN